MIVPLLFFSSGATALVYEVMWSKYLALLLGSTIQAQTVVLAVFMGGLALGNRIFGKRASVLVSPLSVYGYLELMIGFYAFFFPFLYRAADFLFQSSGPLILETRLLLLLLKAFLSLALLIGPTILMGGTLPLLASWLDARFADSSRWTARFYAINSLGAVLGAALAGFFLVPLLGLAATLQATGLANLVIGFIAVILGRRLEYRPVRAETPVTQAAPAAPTAWTTLSALVFLTGAVSMGLEVLASRCLALIFGASLQSFATVLIAFILGIGLGSLFIASRAWKRLETTSVVVILLLATAGWIGFVIFQMEASVDIYRLARTGLARTPVGYRYHQLLTALFSIVVLGVPAAFLGSVLPLCIRGQRPEQQSLSDQVGRLLTANTIGCVVGVLITGFFLMPFFGLRASFLILAVALCVAAFLLGLERRHPVLLAAPPAVAVLVLAVTLLQAESWKYVLTSGVFRARETEVDPTAMEMRRKHIRILFYEDAPDATVSVERGDGIVAPDQISLRINGKVDATSRGDLATQYLLAHLPIIAKPDSRDIFVLGLGSGVTAGALLGHPIRQVVIAENCEPVLRAAQFFAPWNRGIVTNATARIWREDARTVLKLSPQRYDVIISEPSNPWMAGVGSVFSREFYELAAGRLAPGGIMAQWFHIYEMHDGIIDLVLQTFSSVFPFVEIWDPGTGDIIMLGSKGPWNSTLENFEKVFARPEPRRDLERIGLKTPEWLWARQLASQRAGFAIADKGAIQSDEYPVLEYEAPKAFYLGQTSRMLFHFDERMAQSDLAPPAKASALGALNPENIKTVFSEFSSVNTDLMAFLLGQLQSARTVDGPPARAPATVSLFFPPKPPPPDRTDVMNEPLRLLQETELALRQREGIPELLDRMESLLQDPARRTAEVLTPAQFAEFVATIIRVSLREKDFPRAARLLSVGLQRSPGSQELRYLARIFQREAGAPKDLLMGRGK